MICSQCQTDNPADASFCDQCGARLDMVCPNCGESNRRVAKFCRVCSQPIRQTADVASLPAAGASLVPIINVPKHLGEKIFASRHALEGERKHVTVMFADICGSTALIEGRDPEDAQKIIDPVLHLMMKSVHSYEGTVNQVLGDGIMALFGAPLAHEDHALRACYTALAMQEEMRRYRNQLGQTEENGLQISIGMSTGEVVVRSIDTDLNMDYSALGQTTHLAARIQELAGGGTILLTNSTLREVEGFVQVRLRGVSQVKGISQPVETFELIGATTRNRMQVAGIRGLTPLVGRQSEIEFFNRLVSQAAGGRGQVLALMGEPGMGKSRLVHEFIRHQLPPEWLVLEGASVSYGKATPYFPLIEMLRRYFRIGDEQSVNDVRELVAMHVLELDGTLRDAIPPLLSLLGVLPADKQSETDDSPNSWLARQVDIAAAIPRFIAMDPQQRRGHMLDAVKRLFIRESQRQPILVVFEDLHWIDNESQGFLDGLVESLPLARVLLLVNYRPGYSHGWGDKTYYTQLRVEPLQERSAEDLLHYLLGKNRDLAPLRELLLARIEGNPFFAEEIVRSLLETGVLIGEKGAYRPGLKVDSIRIPSSVQNLLADRIDRLPVEEKYLLQTAAVIGMTIPRKLLRVVAEQADAAIDEYLNHLQAAEFLYESALFPQLVYTFKHALIHEVAYGALVSDRRAFLHTKVMSGIETLGGGAIQDHIETLAEHAFRGKLWEKATDYSWQAGEKAIARSAHYEAQLFFQTALEALHHIPESRTKIQQGIDLRLALRNPLFLAGRFEEVHRFLREAESLAENIADDRRLGRVLNLLSSYYGTVGDYEASIECGKRGLGINRDELDLSTVTKYVLGIDYHHMGQYEGAIAILNEALLVVNDTMFKYERFGTANVISVSCRIWLGQCCAELGRFGKAVKITEEAIKIAKEADHISSLAQAHIGLGLVHLLHGNIGNAIEALETSHKICRANDIQTYLPQIGSYLGYAYALEGRMADAFSLMEEAEEQSNLIGRKAGRALRLTWLGHARLLGEQFAAAKEAGERALALARETAERGNEARACGLLGDIIQEQSSDPCDALPYYSLCMDLAIELAMCPLQAHVHRALGRLHRRENRIAQAMAELSVALSSYRSMGMEFWVRRTEQEFSSFEHTECHCDD